MLVSQFRGLVDLRWLRIERGDVVYCFATWPGLPESCGSFKLAKTIIMI